MSTKGKRQYQCEDCKNLQYVHWIELNRAGRPHCNRCGSTRLEPHSASAKDDILEGNTNRLGTIGSVANKGK